MLPASTMQTGADGHAKLSVHAGTITGSYAVTATAGDNAAPARFALTNTPGTPVALTASPRSTPQTATVATDYATALIAVLTDAFGNPVPGATVNFAAPGSGASGTLSAPSATTDANGEAQVSLTANTTSGEFAVTAASTGTPSTAFAMTNVSGAPARMSLTSGTPQSAQVTLDYTQPLVTTITDAFGNPAVGVAVTFTAPIAGTGIATASLAPATAFTDANGNASVTATAGTVTGTFTVTATTPQGAAPVQFTLTNTAGAPASASAAQTASPQATVVGHAFSQPLTIVVFDAFGNRVPGQPITFTVPAQTGSSATMFSTSTTTGLDGSAGSIAIANDLPGSYNVTAHVSDSGITATFALTNLVGAPSQLVLVSGAGQHAMATTAFAQPVVVRVVDELGNPIPGATVTLGTPPTGPSGALAMTSATSDDNGLVSITLVANAVPGGFALTASEGSSVAPLLVSLAVDPIPTTTQLTLPAAVTVNHSLMAQVAVTAAVLTAAGTVNLVDETGAVIASGTLDTSGAAQITIDHATVGHHTITAQFTAQGAFGASQSTAAPLDVEHDDGRLTGAGTDGCNAGGNGGLGILAAALLLVVRRRLPTVRRFVRAGRPLVRLTAIAIAAAAVFSAAPAAAQPAGARAINRLTPAAADSDWFVLDTVSFANHRDVAVGITGDYGYRPLVIYNADGTRRADIVRNQFVLDFSASISLWERFRLSANVPMAPFQNGEGADYNGMSLPKPTYAFGDVTVSGDMRLTGTPDGPFRAAAGIRLIFPTGSRTNYMSDGIFAGDAHGNVAGTMGMFEYAADARLLLRQDTDIADEQFGSELQFSAAAGVRLDDGRLVIGPELLGALAIVSNTDDGHPLELAIGAHYWVTDTVRVGLGGTEGLVHAVGIPEERVMLSFMWRPDR